jgi:hypothetical protein
LITEYASSIEKYPQCRFTTSDGRTFGVFFDGERILKLLELEGVFINHRDKAGLERIKKVAGFIVELGGEDPPRIFEKDIDLALAWEELHAFHRAPITTEEDEEFLDIILDGFQRIDVGQSGKNDGNTQDYIH